MARFRPPDWIKIIGWAIAALAVVACGAAGVYGWMQILAIEP